MAAFASSRKRSADGPATTQPSAKEINDVIEKRLFVARLPDGTTEDELSHIYEEFGDLSECRIVPGRNWAFVKYSTWANAHRALLATDEKKSLRHHPPGRTVAISFAEKTANVGRGGGAALAKGLQNSRVFVRNLPANVTESDVNRLLDDFGEITMTTVLAPKSNKRCAFVTFSIWGEAQDAIEAIDGTTYPGRGGDDSMPLGAVLAEPKGGEGGGPALPVLSRDGPEPKRRRIEYSGSDDPDVLHTEYERLKMAYLVAMDSDGPPHVCTELHESLLALRPRVQRRGSRQGSTSGKSKGKGIIVPHTGPARTSPAGAAASSEQQELNRASGRLYISGLPQESTDEELEALVEQVVGDANITECWVLPGRGCGYVRFSSVASAEEAKDALDERRVTGWERPLRAVWAAPKDSEGGGGGRGARARARSPSWDRDRGSPRGQDNWRGNGGRSNDFGGSGQVEGNRVFIGQLLRGVEVSDIRHIFEPFGDIESCKLISDKGVAYVTFYRASDAQTAVRRLDGKEETGISRGEGLNVQIAKPPPSGR